MSNIYTIYRATNLVNGKVYVGFDSSWPNRKDTHLRNSFVENTKQYDSLFHRAIRKYGVDAFCWDVLYQAKGDEDLGNWVLNTLEPHFIREHSSYDLGYNMTLGGEGVVGFKFTPDQIENLKIVRKGRKPNLGKAFSSDHKQKISSSLIGRTFSEASLVKMRKPKPIVTCPYCGKSGGSSTMTRYHFANCKLGKEG